MEQNSFNTFFKLVEFNQFGIINIIILAIVSLLLLAVSVFLTGSEVAYFSLDNNSLNKMAESEDKRDRIALKLLQTPQKLLATILISDTFIKIAFIVFCSAFITSIFNFEYAPVTGFFLQLAFITFLILLFAETIPKVYASQYSLKVMRRSSRVLYFLQNMLKPFVNLLVNSTSLVNEKITKNLNSNISRDELTYALEMASSSQEEDKEILEGIIKFSNIQVSDIMTSRVDMVDADIKNNFKQVLDIIIKSGYSRIPVFSGSHDNIKGVLFSKDLLPHLDKPTTFRWQSLIRPPYYVPETKKIDNLLSEFQENRIHIAIVVDEYGGISGLVTMEDIMEEIVGDINDEYDEEETLYNKVDDQNFVFEAKILLNDFFKITDIDEEDFVKVTEDVETLAGLILELKGEIPKKGEKIKYGRYDFEVTAVDKRRIQKVKLHIKTDEELKNEDTKK
ncbi:Gliding motility-associated protein GldE [uncultured Paludibacter sp.]|nr:Gliding motility-associated protein GldE [uncultured Paludibacter sp.]